MSAQMVRMNAAASNLANAGSVAGSEAEAYRPVRAVFAQELDRASGLSSVRVSGVVREDVAPVRRHEPGHPLADANGDVWAAPVDENAEMVEMLDSLSPVPQHGRSPFDRQTADARNDEDEMINSITNTSSTGTAPVAGRGMDQLGQGISCICLPCRCSSRTRSTRSITRRCWRRWPSSPRSPGPAKPTTG